MQFVIARLKNGQTHCPFGLSGGYFQPDAVGEILYGPQTTGIACAPLFGAWAEALPAEELLSLIFIAQGMILAGWSDRPLDRELEKWRLGMRHILSQRVRITSKRIISIQQMLEAFHALGVQALAATPPQTRPMLQTA